MGDQVIVIDESKMLAYIGDLPSQLKTVWTENWIKSFVTKKKKFTRVLIVGMGGSGIAGQIVRELFLDYAVSIDTWADYELPGWVDDSTLIVAVSHSGETEETLHAVKTAVESELQVLAITTGGKLAELAKLHNFPCLTYKYNAPPRAAIGCLLSAVLVVLTKLELIPLTEKMFFEGLAELESAVSKKLFPEKAESLAIALTNKVPCVFASAPLFAIATRFVNQLNENSKNFAVAAKIPEIAHNFLVGVDFPIPEKLSVLLLQSNYGFSRNAVRQQITLKLLEEKSVLAVPLSVKSSSALAEQLLFLHFGDLLSFYLAGINGVDPTPVDTIDVMKSELSKKQ